MNYSPKGFCSTDAKFDIRNFIDLLEPAKEKGRYICPACSGNNFTFNAESGAYQCFSGCENRAIRDAIAPLTPERRSAYQREKSRPKSAKEIAREKDAIATSKAWELEQRAIELTLRFDPPYVTEAKLQNEIEAWAQQHGHNPFTARKLLKEAIEKQSPKGENDSEISNLQAEIDRLQSEDLSESELEAKLLDLASRFSKQPKDVRRLYDLKQSERDRLETTEDRKADVDKLLRMGCNRLKLSSFLAPALAKPLEAISDYIGVAPAAMLFTLLPTAASLCKVGTRLELIESTDFYALPILYTGLVAESGSAKSPSQKTILKPLFAMQAEADQDFQLRMGGYEKAKANYRSDPDSDESPVEPTAIEYYTSDVTREGLALIQSKQPDRGILGYLDELSAVVSQQGQYKGGKGSDREALLSGRDGSPIKVNRASGRRISVAQSAYSITGTTQPSTLKELMGDMSDGTGQWARFLWCILPLQPSPYPENAAKYDISEILTGLYRRVEALPPETYRMSPEARRLYIDWYNQLDRLKLEEPKAALRSVYQKMKGDTGVLALLGHIINGSLTVGQTPDLSISEKTMKAAIALSKFCISQVKLIHAMGAEESGELSPIMAKVIEFSRRKGWVTPRDLQTGVRSLKGMKINGIRDLLQELCRMGYGLLEGSGAQIRWNTSPPEKSVDGFVDTSKRDVDGSVDSVDTHKQEPELPHSKDSSHKETRPVDNVDDVDNSLDKLDLRGIPENDRLNLLELWKEAETDQERCVLREVVDQM
jgi:CRISPR-associated protein Cmr3